LPITMMTAMNSKEKKLTGKKADGMPHVLIADDEEQVLAMLSQMLTREGFEISLARNGKEALEVVRQHHLHVVVTDLLMPEMEGIELIRLLRKSAPNIKIIAISGGSRFIDPYDQLRVARLLGADFCFSKPIERREFVEAVRQLLHPD